MGTLTREVNIKIDGDKYENYNFRNIVFSQDLLSPCELSFVMDKKGLEDSIKDSSFPVPKDLIGAKVELTIEATRFDGNNEKLTEFEGIIYHVEISRRSDMFTEQIFNVRACSSDFLLMDHPHCFSYEKMSLKDIVSKTINPYKIENEIKPRTKDTILYTVQYNESNYQFLTRLAQRFGEWMYNDGKKWIFGEIKKKKAVTLDPRNEIQDYCFQADIRHHKVKHAHHDYLKYENPMKSASDISDLTSSGYHELTDKTMDKSASLFTKETFQHLLCSKPEENDLNEPEISIKAQLYGEKMSQVVCTGSTTRADLSIGSVIQINDHFYDSDDSHTDVEHDELIITGIVHSTEVDGHYSNTFTAYPASSEYPPYYQSDIFPASSAQRAKVMDNIDPEKLGRIRVQFLWQEEQDDKMMTPWIRIAQPHGGDGKGFYFIPEIGEEVMVDFENGNAENPFVVGTLYHCNQKPKKSHVLEDNLLKSIRTKNGHTISFVDEGDGGRMGIFDSDYDSGEFRSYFIGLDSDNKLIKLISRGNIELYASNDITMEAGGNIIQHAGNNFEASGDNKAILHSDSKTIVQSEADTDIIGSPTLIHSNSDLTLESMAATKMEANSTINVEASAVTTIKGAMVKIN